MTPKLKDCLDNLIWYENTIVYGATRGVRVGEVLDIKEYIGDSETFYTITIREQLPDYKFKKKTFRYDQDRVIVVDSI